MAKKGQDHAQIASLIGDIEDLARNCAIDEMVKKGLAKPQRSPPIDDEIEISKRQIASKLNDLLSD